MNFSIYEGLDIIFLLIIITYALAHKYYGQRNCSLFYFSLVMPFTLFGELFIRYQLLIS